LLTPKISYSACIDADALQEVGKKTTGVKKTLSTWAKSQALAYWEAMDYDALKEFNFARDIPVGYYAAQLFLSQAHIALGFDRCHSFYVGAGMCSASCH